MMQQYKQFMLLRCRGSLSLRSCTLLTLSTHPPPSSPVTTSPCIRHHSRDTSAVLPRPSFHVVPCTGHIRQPANLFHTSPSSPADDGDKKPEKEEKKIHSMWRKFATLIQNFTAGVKTLYSEVKLMSEYKQKHGNLVIRKSAPVVTEGDKTDLLYSRKELQFMYRTRKDVKKMLPTVILFFIPFLGYFAPVIAFAYPERLLSKHFWTPSQRETLTAAKRDTQKKAFTKVADALKEGTLEDNLSFIPRVIDQFAGKEGVTVPITKSLYQLSNFSAAHKGQLYAGWGVKTWLPLNQILTTQLEKHLEYIFVSDWMIHLEGGVEKLDHSELAAACMERGLDMKQPEAGGGIEEMREKLNAWISVSTLHKECPSLLLAYLPTAQYLTPK